MYDTKNPPSDRLRAEDFIRGNSIESPPICPEPTQRRGGTAEAISSTELAGLLGIGVQTLYKWRDAGLLPPDTGAGGKERYFDWNQLMTVLRNTLALGLVQTHGLLNPLKRRPSTTRKGTERITCR